MLVGLHRSRCGPHIKQVNSKQCKQKKGNGGFEGVCCCLNGSMAPAGTKHTAADRQMLNYFFKYLHPKDT